MLKFTYYASKLCWHDHPTSVHLKMWHFCAVFFLNDDYEASLNILCRIVTGFMETDPNRTLEAMR